MIREGLFARKSVDFTNLEMDLSRSKISMILIIQSLQIQSSELIYDVYLRADNEPIKQYRPTHDKLAASLLKIN